MKTATYRLWVGHSLLFKIANKSNNWYNYKNTVLQRDLLKTSTSVEEPSLATESSRIVTAVAEGQVIVISVTDKACSFEQAISSLFSI